MGEERIYFMIDDAQLVEATTKLDKSAERVKVLNVQTGTIDKRSKVLESRIKQILRRIPVGREAIALQRKLSALGTSMEEEGVAGLAATGISTILLLGVIVNIIRRLERIQKQMIRDMQSFEDETRRGLDLTHEEFMEMERDVIGYATLWEQLTTRMDEAETTRESWDAIADFVIAKIGQLPGDRRPPWIPPQVPRPPEPEWITNLKEWWDNVVAYSETIDVDLEYDYDANLEVPPGE